MLKIQREFNRQYEEAIKIYEQEKDKYDADMLQWKKERRSGKKIGNAPVKPEPPKRKVCIVSDTTTEALIPFWADNPFGLCSIHNEGMTFFGGLDSYRSGSNKDEGIYNDAFDGGYVQVTRKTNNQYTAADHSHCSFCVGIQPECLKLIVKRNPQFLFSGFLARFLPCMPPDIPRHLRNKPVPECIKSAYDRMINTLFDWRTKMSTTPDDPYIVKLTPEAEDLFYEYHKTLSNDRSALPSGPMKAALAKLIGYAPRIALTLHIAHFASKCTDGKFPTSIPAVTEDTMRVAIVLTEWYKHETQRILQFVRPGEIIAGDQEIAAILKHIHKRGGKTTARRVAQNLTVFKVSGGTDQATKKLEEMVQKGLLIAEERQAPNGVTVKYFSLSNVSNANSSNAVSDNIENGVADVGVGEDFSDYFTADVPDYQESDNGITGIDDYEDAIDEIAMAEPPVIIMEDDMETQPLKVEMTEPPVIMSDEVDEAIKEREEMDAWFDEVSKTLALAEANRPAEEPRRSRPEDIVVPF